MQWRIPSTPIATFLVSSSMRDANYHLLLDNMARFCSRFSLVWGRPTMCRGTSLSQRSMELAQQLAPYQLEESRVLEWPCTTIVSPVPIDDRPILRVFTSDPLAIEVLKRTRPSLFHWLGPAFPEDPCFYTLSGDCCLATTSHEKGAIIYIPPGFEALHAALIPFASRSLLCQTRLA